MVEVVREGGTGEPRGEASQEDVLNSWAGVVPSGVGNAIRSRGGEVGETENEA